MTALAEMLDATVTHDALPDPHLRERPVVMVVAPGPRFSTYDVWEGACRGLEAAGADVVPFAYHDDLSYASVLDEIAKAEGKELFQPLALYASHRAVATALATMPDLILVISGTIFPPPTAAMLGYRTRTAVWLTESPYQAEQELYVQQFYRTVFTNEARMVARIQAHRREREHPHPDEVYYLRHAYDPTRHHPLTDVPERYRSDVCFIGSPFPERQALLRGVNWEGIHFVSRGVFDSERVDALETPMTVVPNDEAHLFYAGATVNINHHRRIRFYGQDGDIDAGEAESLNPRVYELAAARCFQICDDSRPELFAIFGDAIPTYRHDDPADLERVVRFYLAHPAERARSVEAAYQAVQAHTFENRMRFVLSSIFHTERNS